MAVLVIYDKSSKIKQAVACTPNQPRAWLRHTSYL